MTTAMSPLASTETILVVDDEPLVVNLTKMMLERFGYNVVTATSGKEAVRLFERWPNVQVDLAVIDLVMPEMDGVELAEHIHKLRPYLPVVYFSAYSEQDSLRPRFARNVPFVAKPFSSLQLTQKIREMLDNPRSDAESA